MVLGNIGHVSNIYSRLLQQLKTDASSIRVTCFVHLLTFNEPLMVWTEN